MESSGSRFERQLTGSQPSLSEVADFKPQIQNRTVKSVDVDPNAAAQAYLFK